MTTGPESIDQFTFALAEQRTSMTDPTGTVTVEVTADGTIAGIRLTETADRMAPALLAETIMSLHNAGLRAAQDAVQGALLRQLGAEPIGAELGDAGVDVDSTETRAPDPTPVESTAPTPRRTPVPTPAASTAPRRPAPDTAQRAAPTPEPDAPEVHRAPSNAPEETDLDEDDYFRTFSVFEHDNHLRRG